jgi:hypothetical protein
MSIIREQNTNVYLINYPNNNPDRSFDLQKQVLLSQSQTMELVRLLSRLQSGSSNPPNYPLSASERENFMFNPSIPGTNPVAANETARVWGDPHFVDPDGGKFDVQGEPGKTYNLLNDTGLILNGRFDAAGKGVTVIGETGLTLTGPRGSSQVQFSKNGTVLINGQSMQPGSMETLGDGGHAYLTEDGKNLTIKTAEGYTIIQKLQGNRIDIDVKSPMGGVATEGRMPGGLLGQTFDTDNIARNSQGKQGEGAIEGNVKDYEVPNGVLGEINPAIQQGVRPEVMSMIGQIFNNSGLTPPEVLPTTNPSTGAPIDWNQSINDQTLDFMMGQTLRQGMMQQIGETNQKNDKLLNLLMAALQMGNIDLAMLLFSSLESREASEMTKGLTQKLVDAQQKRRDLTAQMTSQDKNAQNNLAQVQAGVQEVNDTITLLTSFIKDINDQKNRTMEFSNNFLTNEHQTTMSIVRGMRG